MTTRPAEGTRISYTASSGKRSDATVGPQACDSPCGYWVYIELPDGRTCTWTPLNDLQLENATATSR
jgi:hypothetical protein